MTKLASIIEPMKEAFFVCRLHPKEYADECAARRVEEIKEEEKNAEAEKKKAEALKEEALSGKVDISVPKSSTDMNLLSNDESNKETTAKAASEADMAPKSIDKDAMDVEGRPAEKVTVKKEDDEDEEEEKPKKKKSKKTEDTESPPATPRSSRSTAKAENEAPRSGGRGRGGRKSTPVKKEEEEEEQEEGEQEEEKATDKKKAAP